MAQERRRSSAHRLDHKFVAFALCARGNGLHEGNTVGALVPPVATFLEALDRRCGHPCALHVRGGAGRSALAELIGAVGVLDATMILVRATYTFQVALRVYWASVAHTAEGACCDLRHQVVDFQIPQHFIFKVNFCARASSCIGDSHICAVPELLRGGRLACARVGRHVVPTENATRGGDTRWKDVVHRVLIRDKVASAWQHWASVARRDRLAQFALHGGLPKPPAFVALCATV